MRVALVNPPWTFDGSIYFGCRDPHLPLEYGYARALLARDGHEVLLVDAQLGVVVAPDGKAVSRAREGDSAEKDARPGFDDAIIRAELDAFRPEMTVLTTAPSYLFWRCAPPELRVPMATAAAVRDVAGALVVVGPHASTTPGATLRKLGVDLAVVGECEDVLAQLAATPRARWSGLDAVAWLELGSVRTGGARHATDMKALPALRWPREMLARHRHHHHRFDRTPEGPGAEVEASRGCPYHCTFCAKDNFRDAFRKRPLDVVLDEVDALVASGVRYVYFVDEIFVPDRRLLEALAARDVSFGVQLRIDNYDAAMLDLLGDAGCVSIEAGVESVTERGRSLLAKNCKLDTSALIALLVHAKTVVPFVQANLLDATTDRKGDVVAFCEELKGHGVWVNDPVPLFPYPGSPEYTLRFGPCDDFAWERAHEQYLGQFESFSDIQDGRPKPLAELEGRSWSGMGRLAARAEVT